MMMSCSSSEMLSNSWFDSIICFTLIKFDSVSDGYNWIHLVILQVCEDNDNDNDKYTHKDKDPRSSKKSVNVYRL